jgi:hypothetical protein
MATVVQVMRVFGEVLASITVVTMLVCLAAYGSDYIRRWRDRRIDERATQKLLAAAPLVDPTTELDEVMAATFAFPRRIKCDHCNRWYYIETSRGVRDAITLHGRYDCRARTERLTP